MLLFNRTCARARQLYPIRRLSTQSTNSDIKFETVFSLPSIKYIAIINRLKVYQLAGTSIGIPVSGILEMANIVSDYTFMTTTYIGLTAAALLSLGTLPFSNIIGYLYISDDNKTIKISSVNFWGKRINKIINVEDWVPILELPPKTMDVFYLSPQLTDGTKYKLLVKFGKVINSSKMGQVLE